MALSGDEKKPRQESENSQAAFRLELEIVTKQLAIAAAAVQTAGTILGGVLARMSQEKSDG